MRWIDQDQDLDGVLQDLAEAKTYYIDTEFESTRRQTRLSVIQVSRGDELYLLDALKLSRIRELGEVMVRADVQWVLHSGLQDVELLLEAFRQPKPPQLFDTQLAWALLGPESSVSLAYLQFKLLGIRLMKTHQADDWIRRPLPPSQLRYAASDIEHLPKLYELLSVRLEQTDKREALNELCHEMLWPKPELPPELTLSSFRNAWQLHPKNQAALRYLMSWYNELPAWERSHAPGVKTLLSIASRMPKTAKDLLRIKGLPPQFSRGHAETIVRGISRAVREATDNQFVSIDPEPYTTFEDVVLDGWLNTLRCQVSAAAEVAPELAFPPRLLRQLRDAVSSGTSAELPEQLCGWRSALLEPHLRRFLTQHPPEALSPNPVGRATPGRERAPALNSAP